jgi:hypothetical protein
LSCWGWWWWRRRRSLLGWRGRRLRWRGSDFPWSRGGRGWGVVRSRRDRCPSYQSSSHERVVVKEWRRRSPISRRWDGRRSDVAWRCGDWGRSFSFRLRMRRRLIRLRLLLRLWLRLGLSHRRRSDDGYHRRSVVSERLLSRSWFRFGFLFLYDWCGFGLFWLFLLLRFRIWRWCGYCCCWRHLLQNKKNVAMSDSDPFMNYAD